MTRPHNGAPHLDPAATKKFSGKDERPRVKPGIGHNLTQEVPNASG